MRLLFVGDGARDAATVPRLVERFLGVPVHEETRPWARLHRGRGYRAKLRFALKQAQVSQSDGLVATVDADKDRQDRRLRELKAAGDEHRSASPAFPTTLGRAIPHGEAWLLDDPSAVKNVLGLLSSTEIPTVTTRGDCKSILEGLWRGSDRTKESPTIIWAEIARQVDPQRSNHRHETGFEDFLDEVRRELGPLSSDQHPG